MIIVMEKGAPKESVERVIKRLEANGFAIHLSEGKEKTIIGAVGDKRSPKVDFALEAMDWVEKVIPILSPYKLASREFKTENSVVKIDDLVIGGNEIHVMAGPCAVESKEQVLEVAQIVKQSGAKIMRGGAFKPRTSPYSFQGLEEKGLEYLALAREKTGLKIISEVMDTRSVNLVAQHVDILQIGARNMQNFPLLKEVAKSNKPVLLKRGIAATLEEWAMAAEYILDGGNERVILCERGIRSFDTIARNTLDICAVPIMKQLTHLPIIVDPSHGTGKWQLVSPMAKASIAAGADGLILEVHPNPIEALCDGPQSLLPERYLTLMNELEQLAAFMGRKLEGPSFIKNA